MTSIPGDFIRRAMHLCLTFNFFILEAKESTPNVDPAHASEIRKEALWTSRGICVIAVRRLLSSPISLTSSVTIFRSSISFKKFEIFRYLVFFTSIEVPGGRDGSKIDE